MIALYTTTEKRERLVQKLEVDYALMKDHISISFVGEGSGGSMSYVVGSNSSYKPITNTAWVRAQLCKLQERVPSTPSCI